MPSPFSLILSCSIAFALTTICAACVHNHRQDLGQTSNSAGGGLAGLLPTPRQVPKANSAAADQVKCASEYAFASDNCTCIGDDVAFTPNSANDGLEAWAYACYEFNLPDFDQAATVNLEWIGEFPSQAYVGVSNWTRNRWEWNAATGANVSFQDHVDAGEDLLDPENGRIMLAVVLGGDGTHTLKQITIGEPGGDPWVHTWGGSDEDFLNDLQVDGDGNIYICGETWSYGQGEMSALLAKLSPEGEMLWSGVITGPGRQSAKAMCVYGNDLFVVGTHREEGSSSEDILISRVYTDGTGVLDVTTRTWGGAEPDGAACVTVQDGELLVAGYTYNLTGSTGRTDCDTCLLRLEPTLASVTEAAHWGTSQYDSACAVVSPPDIATAGGVVVVQNVSEYADPWGSVEPLVSIVYDFTDITNIGINDSEHPSCWIGGAAAGLGSDVYLCGRVNEMIPGSRNRAVAVMLALSEDEGEKLQWSNVWQHENEYSSLQDIEFRDSAIYLGGVTGSDLFPNFTDFPLIISGDSEGLDPSGCIWGSGITGSEFCAMAIRPGELLSVGGTAPQPATEISVVDATVQLGGQVDYHQDGLFASGQTFPLNEHPDLVWTSTEALAGTKDAGSGVAEFLAAGSINIPGLLEAPE